MKIGFFFFILFFSSRLTSQQILEHLTKKDGLPSNQISGIAQDKEDYIWIGTPNGAVRYDGKTMKIFTVDDGLTTNEVIGFFTDDKGRVWIDCFGGQLCYYLDGKVYNPKKDARLGFLPKNFFRPVVKLLNDSLVYSKEEVYKDSLVWTYKRYLNLQTLRLKKELLYCKKISDYSYTLKSYINEYKWTKDAPVKEFTKRELEQKVIFDYETENYRIFQLMDYRVFVLDKDGKILLSINSKSTINQALENSDKCLYLISTEILFLYKKSNLFSTPLSMKAISICENRDGNIWLASPEGAFCISGKSLHFTPNKLKITDHVYCISKLKGSLYCGSENNRVYNYTQNLIYSNKLSTYGASRVLDLFELNNQIYTLGDHPSYSIASKKNLKTISNGANKNIVKISENRFIYSTFKSLDDLVIGGEKLKSTTVFYHRVFNTFYANDKTIWIATESGLKYRHIDSIKFISQSLPFKNVEIVKHIYQDGQGNMIFSTNNGIVIKNGKNYFNINKDNGLADNQINKTFTSSIDNKLFICTNKGFNVLNYSFKNNKLIYSIKTYTTSDGLPSEEVYCALEDSGKIYVGTQGGLAIFPANDTIKSYTIPLKLESIYLNEKKVDSLNPKLQHDENTLEFRFSAFYYKRNKEMLFSYQLFPLNKKPIISEKPDIVFRGLEPNTYTLEVRVYDRHYPHLIKSKVYTYTFSIKPPFYKAWWFYVLITGLFVSLGFIAYIVYNRRRQMRLLEKQEILKQIVVHKLDALKGQMNPHFIFNSLNTVQHFIVNHNEKDAMNFIAKFSSLIRKMLENARQDRVRLDKEIIFLKEYIEIEQIRYSYHFDVIFQIELEDEDHDIEIPTMLIQPLIENAIKHGVSNLKERRGVIHITFRIENSSLLIISIKDNGFGNSNTQKGTINNSAALEIIRDRLSIYEVNGIKGDFSLTINDFGAEATLKIPL